MEGFDGGNMETVGQQTTAQPAAVDAPKPAHVAAPKRQCIHSSRVEPAHTSWVQRVVASADPDCSLFTGLTGYRLGDMKSQFFRTHDKYNTVRTMPHSFAAALSAAHVDGNSAAAYKALLPLIEKRRAAAGALTAPPDSAVIHLRTGDVLDSVRMTRSATVFELLCRAGPTHLNTDKRHWTQSYVYPSQHWAAAVAAELRRLGVRR
jgi:hypothetical protein